MKTIVWIFLTTISLLTFSKIIFAQAPNLSSASGFAIFTSVGAINNLDATSITGDVGTNAGAFTGFPPGFIDGQIQIENAVSLQASTDINSAYTYLSGMTCGAVLGTTLGNGQILTPNVYCMGAASTLNGDLILDGQNDPDALFVFQIDGAFATSTFTNILLINEASLCNVYWQINGQFDLGDNSAFKGTLIANGAINLLENSSLTGRALSIAGAVSTHFNIISVGQQPTASTITAGGPTTFCSGNSVELSGNAGGTWSSGSSSASINVNISGDYFVTNTTSCSIINSNHIIVTVQPECNVTANTTAAVITAGSTVTLTGGGAVSYLWSDGVIDGVGFTPFTSISYIVTGTDANSCTNTAAVTVTVNPLPIELLNFMAYPADMNVQFDWITASETNNDYFTIERSKDGITFEEVLRMQGAGNSNILLYYTATDIHPFDNSSYYRLKQTDFDGMYSYSDLVNVDLKNGNSDITKNILTVYPNPSVGLFNFSYKGNNDQLLSFEIYNEQGQRIYYSEQYQSAIDLTGNSNGIYYVHLNSAAQNVTEKLLLKK